MRGGVASAARGADGSPGTALARPQATPSGSSPSTAVTPPGGREPHRDPESADVPDVRLLTGDLTDLSSLMRALDVAQPEEFYNLGALSFVAYSWENAHVTTAVTASGVLNALEATRLHAGADVQAVRFHQASSSEMFGKAQQVPQTESTLLWPRSPYGVAKVFGHYMTINHRESYGMHASSGILFNHESPRRGEEFVTRKVSQAVACISLGLQPNLVLGNLEARRALHADLLVLDPPGRTVLRLHHHRPTGPQRPPVRAALPSAIAYSSSTRFFLPRSPGRCWPCRSSRLES